MLFFTAIEASIEMNMGYIVQEIMSFLQKTPDETHIITNSAIYAPFLIGLSSKKFTISYLDDDVERFDEILNSYDMPTFTLLLDKVSHPQCERIIICTSEEIIDRPVLVEYGHLKIIDTVITPEQNYLNLMKDVISTGEIRDDRTGTGTRSLFGVKMDFDLTKGFPLLTTKYVPFKHILVELFWFLSGSMDTSFLEKNGVTIWRGNTSREFLDKRGLHGYKEGQVGPLYGYQWRHFGESTHQTGVDQLKRVLHILQTDPTSRRMVISAWNPVDLDKMVLEPCHVMFQLYVREGKWLDGMLYMRSNDLFLGAPWNISCYALLIHMFAHLSGYNAGKLVYTVGDAHLYEDHIQQVKEQIKRPLRRLPTLSIINRNQESIDDFKLEDFVIDNYYPHPRLKAKMAI
jgi:thymidylate synthase